MTEPGGLLSWGNGEEDAAMAVIAHGLLNSVSAIQMGAYALKESWDRMSEKQRNEVLDIVADQAGHVRGILQDMIRGLPGDVIRALNGLERDPASAERNRAEGVAGSDPTGF